MQPTVTFSYPSFQSCGILITYGKPNKYKVSSVKRCKCSMLKNGETQRKFEFTLPDKYSIMCLFKAENGRMAIIQGMGRLERRELRRAKAPQCWREDGKKQDLFL